MAIDLHGSSNERKNSKYSSKYSKIQDRHKKVAVKSYAGEATHKLHQRQSNYSHVSWSDDVEGLKKQHLRSTVEPHIFSLPQTHFQINTEMSMGCKNHCPAQSLDLTPEVWIEMESTHAYC